MKGPLSERLARPCPVCGDVFTPRKVGSKWTKSCSKACANELTARAMRAGGARKAAAGKVHPEQVVLRCEVCGREWREPPSQIKGRRTCSMECGTEYRRRRGGADRRGERNPNWKGGKRAGIRDRAGERRWYAVVTKRCVCGARGNIALHHCIYRQTLRHLGGDVWDPRNALALCGPCHADHHARRQVLPLSRLPDSVFEFAAELMGAGPAYEYLRRHYAGGDPRLDALLS